MPIAQSEMPDLTLELDLARNLLGARLRAPIRERIMACVADPSPETWDGAFSIIVGSNGWTTLWQAVRAVRPEFPCVGPMRGRGGVLISGWTMIPDRAALIAAIRYATH